MEGGGRGARIIFFTFCSAFAALAVSMTIYYLRKHKGMKKKDTSGLSRVEREEKASISFAEEIELADVLKQNGHGEYTKATISSLLRLLERVDDLTLEKLLVILSNCSAFTRNQNVIRECGGLPHLVALLMHPNKGVCIKAVQLLSNLAMNEANQESLKGSTFDVIKNLEYCDISQDEELIVAHLRLLVNLSATNIAHEEIMTGAQEYFNILSQSLSQQIQQQVLRLLVNLSCNAENFEGLLELKPLLILQTFMLPDNTDDIILRAVTISANLLSSADQYTEQLQATVTEDINILYFKLMQLLDHPSEEIQSQAKRAFRSIFAFRMMYTP